MMQVGMDFCTPQRLPRSIESLRNQCSVRRRRDRGRGSFPSGCCVAARICRLQVCREEAELQRLNLTVIETLFENCKLLIARTAPSVLAGVSQTFLYENEVRWQRRYGMKGFDDQNRQIS